MIINPWLTFDAVTMGIPEPEPRSTYEFEMCLRRLRTEVDRGWICSLTIDHFFELASQQEGVDASVRCLSTTWVAQIRTSMSRCVAMPQFPADFQLDGAGCVVIPLHVRGNHWCVSVSTMSFLFGFRIKYVWFSGLCCSSS
jgi:hypothetical protein